MKVAGTACLTTKNQDGDSQRALADLRCSQTSRIDQTIVLSMKIHLAKLADISKVVNEIVAHANCSSSFFFFF